LALVERALSSRRFGPYTLQAAIAAVHAEATDAAATDWAQIVALYSLLARAEPSPVVELNRAVAVAMRDGPLAGLELIDAILDTAISRITTWPIRRGRISLPAVGKVRGGGPPTNAPRSHAAGAGAAVSERRLAELADGAS
jgi:predicted RNA polymerase sigma factor